MTVNSRTRDKETVNTPDGVLVRIKNKLCIALGIDAHRLKILIDRFVMRAFNGVTNTSMHFDKINTYNEINKNKMTIKVFFKFLKIIDVKSVSISVKIVTRRDVEVTVVEDIHIFSSESVTEVPDVDKSVR